MKNSKIVLKNAIVFQEPGRFGGWPANHGIWNWGDEILVGFERAYYQPHEKGHSIVPDCPAEPALTRSLDGCETCRLEAREHLRMWAIKARNNHKKGDYIYGNSKAF